MSQSAYNDDFCAISMLLFRNWLDWRPHVRGLFRNWLDLRLKYKDPFQKLAWLTTHIRGLFRNWLDLRPKFRDFFRNIGSVRPIYGLWTKRYRSVRPIYGLFARKYMPYDPKMTFWGEVGPKILNTYNLDGKNQKTTKLRYLQFPCIKNAASRKSKN